MNDPLVSIVIPVYNGENFLREAIDSALAQTYKNCEIIVVNDGSTDDTETICRSYGDQIRYFYKENGGVATALNLAIENMRGEYFSWLSHDDIYFPRKVEAQIEALRKDGDMTKLVYGDYELFYQDTGKRTPCVLNKVHDETRMTQSVYPVIKGLLPGCALLIHRSHFERVGTFNPAFRCVQDYDLWFRMFRGQTSVYVNEWMYIVRLHDKQGEKTIPTMQTEEITLYKGYVDNLTDEEMEYIYGSRFLFLFNIWLRIYKRGGDIELYEKLCAERDRQHIPNRLKRLLQVATDGRELPICIFGAGQWGNVLFLLMSLCGLPVHCFIDNDEKKHNTEITTGILCQSLKSLSTKKNDVLILVGIKDVAAVIQQLAEEGFRYVLTRNQLKEKLISTV